MKVLATEELLLTAGFTKIESIIIPSYHMDVAYFPDYGYKVMTISLERGNQYIFLREGGIDKPRHEDDVCTLYNGDIHGPLYMDRVELIYEMLTDKKLMPWQNS